MNKKEKAKVIQKILNKTYPKIPIPLNYKNTFTLLISVLLSAQCTDVNVNNVTRNIYPKYHKPEHFVKLGRKKIEKLIKSIGLFRNKSKSVYLLSKQLIKKHSGKVPKNIDDLYDLPGVGKKTASVYQNVVLKKPKIAVDTHVFRVSNRLGIVKEKNTDKTQDRLEEIIPSKWKMKAHHFLILHGRKICKSQKPKCEICKISSFCDYLSKSF